MRTLLILFLTFLFRATINICSGQGYFQHFTIKDGLSSNIVYSLVQDKQGFIWCATENAVNRFDGFSFASLNVWNGLPDNDVPLIRTDVTGNIWLFGFDGTTTVVKNGKIYSVDSITIASGMNVELFSYQNETFIIDYKGVHVFDSNLVCIKRLWFDRFTRRVESFHCWRINNEIFIKRLNHLYAFDGIRLEMHNGFSSEIAPKSKVLVTNDSVLVFLANQGIFKLHNRKTTLIFSGNPNMLKLLLIQGNILYYSSGNHIYRLKIDKDNEQPEFFMDFGSPVVDLILDKAGNFWYATYGNGIFLFRESQKLINPVNIIPHSEQLSCLLIDNQNDIWASNEKAQIFLNYKNKWIELPSKNIINVNKIRFIRKYQDDGILIGDDKGLLIIKNSDKFKEQAIRSSKTCLKPNDNLKFISGTTKNVESLNDVIYLGVGFEGLKKIQGNHVNKIINYRTYCHCLLPDEKIIVSTMKGLKLVNGNKLTHWPGSKILNGNFRKLVYLGGSQIFFITSNQQIGVFDYVKGKVQLFRLGNFYQRLVYNDAAINKNGYVYLSTNLGLFEIILTEKNRDFREEVLVFKTIINQPVNSIYLSEDALYFGISSKVYSYNLTSNFSKYSNYNALLEIRPAGANWLTRHNETSFRPRQNYLKCLVFDPGFNTSSFAYRIKAFKTRWEYTTSNLIELNNLNPGTYEVEILLFGNTNLSEYKVLKKIIIQARLIDQFWFRITLVGIILLIIVGFVSANYRSKLKASIIKNQYGAAQIKALNFQMNPHFIVNSINSIQYLLMKKQNSLAGEYLSKLSSIFSRVITNSQNLFIPVKSELQLIKNYLQIEQLRFSKQFEVKFVFIEIDENDETNIPPMFLQPFIENAIWHGLLIQENNNPVLTITCTKTDNSIIFQIHDNGKGINSKSSNLRIKEHPSTAIRNIYERVDIYHKIHQYKIDVNVYDLSDQRDKGTLVVIKFPVKTK